MIVNIFWTVFIIITLINRMLQTVIAPFPGMNAFFVRLNIKSLKNLTTFVINCNYIYCHRQIYGSLKTRKAIGLVMIRELKP